MGNGQTALGHMLALAGSQNIIGMENSARLVINMDSIEPWPARAMIRANLAKQADLCRRTPLKKIPVDVAMSFFEDKVGGWFSTSEQIPFVDQAIAGSFLTSKRTAFVDQAIALLVTTGTRHTSRDRQELYDIFDSMDLDGNGILSIGEWALGLTVFFKGSQEQCVHAVFQTLDRNGDQVLSKSELQEYLQPFVKAMIPPEAEPLWPLLLAEVTDKIFRDMDSHQAGTITSDEMIEWSRKGNNIVDGIAKTIEHEVCKIWMHQKDREHRLAQGETSLFGQYSPEAYTSTIFDRSYGGMMASNLASGLPTLLMSTSKSVERGGSHVDTKSSTA